MPYALSCPVLMEARRRLAADSHCCMPPQICVCSACERLADAAADSEFLNITAAASASGVAAANIAATSGKRRRLQDAQSDLTDVSMLRFIFWHF